MKILVTGGTGYIGSHTIVDLINKGHEIVSVDNFSNSDPEVVGNIEKVSGVAIKNYNIDLADLNQTVTIFQDHPDFDGIIHFAAFKYVGESTQMPLLYFKNNLNSLMNILHCQRKWDIPNMVFSSSCSVYGNPDKQPVTEETPQKEAESPYARTKQMGEMIIRDFSKKHSDLNFLLLRYFNPAGIHTSGIIREKAKKEVETLVPIIEEVYTGKREQLTIFGGDYPTRDGTCIRDYIYIMDLAEAHTLGMEYLKKQSEQGVCSTYNLGTGNGITVLEMVKAMEKVSGTSLNYSIGDRRNGDVIEVYADYSAAKNDLGWIPKHGIEDIFQSIL